MSVVDGLQKHLNISDTPMVVVAPGVDRLPFFFPIEDVRIDEAPIHLDQLEDVTFFVYGSPESDGAYDGIPIRQNQVVGALSLAGDHNDEHAIMRRAWWYDDGIFNYNVYELHLDRRFVPPYIQSAPEQEVIFGDFARYLGHDIGGLELWPDRRVIFHAYFEVIAPPPDDYMLFLHLQHPGDPQTVWAAWDGPVTQTEDGRYYSTLVWQPGEYISDERVLELQDTMPPVGDGYQLVMGMYDLATGDRVPISIDGVSAGDSVTVNNRISIIPEDPG
jgi:hypothetical protein